MSEPMGEDLTVRFEPVREAMRAVADRLEQEPDKPALLNSVLEVASEVARDADQSVLAGMLALFPTSGAGETNRQYAARLREEVAE
ncbi:hypothetical protein [Streptomyces afghaniensis]|uniref:hypothetical protein n=1 Tax=Streptomyces afghaniensis TaxID=66865 RepID=UPI00277D6673|nr:hypothetical protein [Streptomyces afghaniensis]MDQ1018844.1 hypothetical protein [Streptomyces afghaniensis]